MHVSTIAKFRQEQVLQEQAAQQALHGLASVANHTSINARMQRGADYLLTLLEAGKHEEVIQLMETKTWGLEEDGKEHSSWFLTCSKAKSAPPDHIGNPPHRLACRRRRSMAMTSDWAPLRFAQRSDRAGSAQIPALRLALHPQRQLCRSHL